MALYQSMPVLGDLLRFPLDYNTGITFGLFANNGFALIIVTGIIVFGMFI